MWLVKSHKRAHHWLITGSLRGAEVGSGVGGGASRRRRAVCGRQVSPRSVSHRRPRLARPLKHALMRTGASANASWECHAELLRGRLRPRLGAEPQGGGASRRFTPHCHHSHISPAILLVAKRGVAILCGLAVPLPGGLGASGGRRFAALHTLVWVFRGTSCKW